jgi:uncharacterized protein (DUF1015 family)
MVSTAAVPAAASECIESETRFRLKGIKMANVVPFRGVLYNPDQIENLSDVVAPPYDVISRDEQAYFHQRHPKNIIRLILGETRDTDTPRDNPHSRAAGFFRSWLAEGTLAQDRQPALYLTSVDFSLEGRTITRYGFIALVGLEPFEKGVVLPHERTFSKVKSERLDLMKACHANFSPIFSLYSGANGILERLKASAGSRRPDMDVVDHKGIPHRLWRIVDADVHRYVTAAMADKRLFIADGHHRYETALTYRDWVAGKNNDFTDDHPANFVMMYLCSMEDPGMLIRPAHRLLIDLEPDALSRLRQKAPGFFDIETFDFNGENREAAQKAFTASLKAGGEQTVIGVYVAGRSSFFRLALRAGVMEKAFGREMPASLLGLDVTVLTRLVFMEILGFDQKRLDDASRITYDSLTDGAIAAVDENRVDAAFILNPTRIEQVREVSGNGLIMPRKSTYFYPKVLSGRVLNILTA